MFSYTSSKEGWFQCCKNYRGFTLMNTLGKIFSNIWNDHWYDLHGIVCNNQNGFRQGRSTVDFIFVLQLLIFKTLHSGGKIFCAFVDFSKAFDTLQRNLLWLKLHTFCLSTKFFQ